VASRTVEGLHQRGLLRRHEDVADRRMKRVRLSDALAPVLARPEVTSCRLETEDATP